jgi:hypothetical protein
MLPIAAIACKSSHKKWFKQWLFLIKFGVATQNEISSQKFMQTFE